MSSLSNPNAFSGIVKGLGEGGGGSVDFPTDITNPQDGQLLKYDATSEKWVNVDNEPCVVDVVVTEEDRKATSDDVTNYINDMDGQPIVEGADYYVTNLNISINDLESNKIYRLKIDPSYRIIISFSYELVDDIYFARVIVINANYQDLFVVNKYLNLKMFEKADSNDPNNPK